VFFYVRTGPDDAQGNPTQAPIAATTIIPLGTRTKLAQGYGLPPFLKNVPPFNALQHTGEPLEQTDVITVEELTTVIGRVAEYNAIINTAAAARNIPVADVAGLFNRVVSTTGEHLGPITISGAPVTGGFFSFDFFHLTELGNEFIKAINTGYHTEIPLASITQLFADNGAFFGDGTPNGSANSLIFTSESNSGIADAALQRIVTMWAQPAVHKFRGRAVNH
jgi:hypothetical protein